MIDLFSWCFKKKPDEEKPEEPVERDHPLIRWNRNMSDTQNLIYWQVQTVFCGICPNFDLPKEEYEVLKSLYKPDDNEYLIVSCENGKGYLTISLEKKGKLYNLEDTCDSDTDLVCVQSGYEPLLKGGVCYPMPAKFVKEPLYSFWLTFKENPKRFEVSPPIYYATSTPVQHDIIDLSNNQQFTLVKSVVYTDYTQGEYNYTLAEYPSVFSSDDLEWLVMNIEGYYSKRKRRYEDLTADRKHKKLLDLYKREDLYANTK